MQTEILEKPSTELTLPERAAVVLHSTQHEKQLQLLVAEAQTITEIKNPDGREQCHSTLMTLRNARIAIETVAKTAREDATAFAKAIIAEETRLKSITEAEELRLRKLRDQWDADRKAERDAKIEAERQRIARIRALIDEVRAFPLQAVGKSSTEISQLIFQLSGTPNYESFGEFADEFKAVRLDVLDKLAKAETAQKNAEFDAARLKAEREELTRLRAESEARQAAKEAELKAQQEQQAAELARRQAELDAQRAEVERRAAELRREQESAALRTIVDLKHAEQVAEEKPIATAPVPTPVPDPAPPAITQPAVDDGPQIRIGEICNRLGFTVNAEFLAKLGFKNIEGERSAKLYREADFPAICMAISRHVEAVAQQPVKAI